MRKFIGSLVYSHTYIHFGTLDALSAASARADIAQPSMCLGSVQNLFGDRAGFIDRGADTFFEKKGGQELFFRKK